MIKNIIIFSDQFSILHLNKGLSKNVQNFVFAFFELLIILNFCIYLENNFLQELMIESFSIGRQKWISLEKKRSTRDVMGRFDMCLMIDRSPTCKSLTPMRR